MGSDTFSSVQAQLRATAARRQRPYEYVKPTGSIIDALERHFVQTGMQFTPREKVRIKEEHDFLPCMNKTFVSKEVDWKQWFDLWGLSFEYAMQKHDKIKGTHFLRKELRRYIQTFFDHMPQLKQNTDLLSFSKTDLSVEYENEKALLVEDLLLLQKTMPQAIQMILKDKTFTPQSVTLNKKIKKIIPNKPETLLENDPQLIQVLFKQHLKVLLIDYQSYDFNLASDRRHVKDLDFIARLMGGKDLSDEQRQIYGEVVLNQHSIMCKSR